MSYDWWNGFFAGVMAGVIAMTVTMLLAYAYLA